MGLFYISQVLVSGWLNVFHGELFLFRSYGNVTESYSQAYIPVSYTSTEFHFHYTFNKIGTYFFVCPGKYRMYLLSWSDKYLMVSENKNTVE